MIRRPAAQRGGSAVDTAGAQWDARLVVPAVAVWLVTAAALPGDTAVVAGAGAVALVAGAVLLLTARRAPWPVPSTRVGPGRWWRRDPRPVVVVVGFACCCAAAALLAVSTRLAVRDASPARQLAADGATVQARLVVAGDPRRLPRATGAPESVILPARLEWVRSGPTSWRGSERVLVIAPAAGWSGLLPSQRAVATARLRPPRDRDLTVAVLTTRDPPERVSPPSWPQRAAGGLRAGLREATGGLPPAVAGLVPALAVGDESRMDERVVASFRETGLAHLTAVSGANVAMITGAVLLALRGAAVRPQIAAVVAGAVLVGFVVVARPSPSVVRAAIMGGLGLLAFAAGRPKVALPALATTVIVAVLWQPELSRSVGFTLSVVATAGLILLAPGWVAWLRRRGTPAGVAEAIAVPAAAFVTTAPVVAGVAGTVGLLTIPANLLAAPAVAPCTVLGFVAALLSPIAPPVAWLAAWLAGVPARWILLVAERGAMVPHVVVPWPVGWVGAFALAAVITAVATAARSRVARRGLLAAATGMLLVVFAAPALRWGWPPAGWVMVACDVGQGDAVVLSAGAGTAVVVDAGPEPAVVDACLRRLRVRRVPLLVVTHLHADHVGGVAGVLRGRHVGGILVGPSREPEAAWRQLRHTAACERVPVVTAPAESGLDVGALRLRIFAPVVPYRNTRSDPNNSSVVLRVERAGRVFLLTGDVEVQAQRDLLREHGDDLAAHVLKVPHHGSAYSVREFLTAVHPRWGVISVGEGNDYGHPAPSLLAELSRLGVRTLRTDQDGDIAVVDEDGRLAAYPRGRSRSGRGGARRRRRSRPRWRPRLRPLPGRSGVAARGALTVAGAAATPADSRARTTTTPGSHGGCPGRRRSATASRRSGSSARGPRRRSPAATAGSMHRWRAGCSPAASTRRRPAPDPAPAEPHATPAPPTAPGAADGDPARWSRQADSPAPPPTVPIAPPRAGPIQQR